MEFQYFQFFSSHQKNQTFRPQGLILFTIWTWQQSHMPIPPSQVKRQIILIHMAWKINNFIFRRLVCKNIFKSSDIRLTRIRNNIVLKMSWKHFDNRLICLISSASKMADMTVQLLSLVDTVKPVCVNQWLLLNEAVLSCRPCTRNQTTGRTLFSVGATVNSQLYLQGVRLKKRGSCIEKEI